MLGYYWLIVIFYKMSSPLKKVMVPLFISALTSKGNSRS
jgi:hypothetical protein